MAKLKSNPREDAILKLQGNVAATTLKLALEKKPEISTIEDLLNWFGTKPGEQLIQNIVSVEAEERAKIDLHYQAPYLMAAIQKCNHCKNRGYTGIEVVYEKHSNGSYKRDATGEPILRSSTPRICKCVKKTVELLKDATIIRWAKEEYERQEKQKAEEANTEIKSATKKRVAKTESAAGSGDVPKTTTRKRKATAK